MVLKPAGPIILAAGILLIADCLLHEPYRRWRSSQLQPTTPPAGYSLFREDRLPEAEASLREFVSRTSDERAASRALVWLGQVLEAERRSSEALRCYVAGLQVAHTRPEPRSSI